MTDELITDVVQHDTVYGLVTLESTLYAARQSGLYRSADGGQTWTNCLASLQDAGTLVITALAIRGGMIFAGTKGAVLYLSDGGVAWTIVGLASPPPEVVAIAISPHFAEDGTAVVGTTDDGVFITTDQGSNWTAWNFGLIDTHVFAVAFSPCYAEDRTIFAGTESGIFVSKNGGRGWIETDFPMNAAPVISLAASPSFAADGLIYAGTEDHGLWASHDRGTTWQQVAADQISGAVNIVIMQEQPTQALAILLEDKVMRSTDHGQTWSQTSLYVQDDRLPMTMCIHPNNITALIVGYSDGAVLPVI